MSSTSWGKDYFTATCDQFKVSCNFQLSFAAFVYSGNSVTVMWWQATELDWQANNLQLNLNKWTIIDQMHLFKHFDTPLQLQEKSFVLPGNFCHRVICEIWFGCMKYSSCLRSPIMEAEILTQGFLKRDELKMLPSNQAFYNNAQRERG